MLEMCQQMTHILIQYPIFRAVGFPRSSSQMTFLVVSLALHSLAGHTCTLTKEIVYEEEEETEAITSKCIDQESVHIWSAPYVSPPTLFSPLLFLVHSDSPWSFLLPAFIPSLKSKFHSLSQSPLDILWEVCHFNETQDSLRWVFLLSIIWSSSQVQSF